METKRRPDEVLGENEAARLTAKLQAIFDRHVRARPLEDDKYYKCVDCLDTGFLLVDGPHTGEVPPGHSGPAYGPVARPCWSCRRGQCVEAGLWYRLIYRFGRNGRRAPVKAEMERFEQWLSLRHVVLAERIKACFDEIVERETRGTAT